MSINYLRSSTFFNGLNDPIKDLKDPVEPFIENPIEDSQALQPALEKFKKAPPSSWKRPLITVGAIGIATYLAINYYFEQSLSNPGAPSNRELARPNDQADAFEIFAELRQKLKEQLELQNSLQNPESSSKIENSPKIPTPLHLWSKRFTLAATNLDFDQMKEMLNERFNNFCSNADYFKSKNPNSRCPAQFIPYFEVFTALAKSFQPVKKYQSILNYISTQLDKETCYNSCPEKIKSIFNSEQFAAQNLLCLKDLLSTFSHFKSGCLNKEDQLNLLNKFYPYFSQFSSSKDIFITDFTLNNFSVANSPSRELQIRYINWYLTNVLPNLPSYEKSNLRKKIVEEQKSNSAIRPTRFNYARGFFAEAKNSEPPVSQQAFLKKFKTLPIKIQKGFLDLTYGVFAKTFINDGLNQDTTNPGYESFIDKLLDQGLDFSKPLFLSENSRPIPLMCKLFLEIINAKANDYETGKAAHALLDDLLTIQKNYPRQMDFNQPCGKEQHNRTLLHLAYLYGSKLGGFSKTQWNSLVTNILEKYGHANPNIWDNFGKTPIDYDPATKEQQKRAEENFKRWQKNFRNSGYQRQNSGRQEKMQPEPLPSNYRTLLQKNNKLKEVQALANEKEIKTLVLNCLNKSSKQKEKQCQKLEKKCAKIFKDFHPDKHTSSKSEGRVFSELIRACVDYLKANTKQSNS